MQSLRPVGAGRASRTNLRCRYRASPRCRHCDPALGARYHIPTRLQDGVAYGVPLVVVAAGWLVRTELAKRAAVVAEPVLAEPVATEPVEAEPVAAQPVRAVPGGAVAEVAAPGSAGREVPV